MSLFLYSSYSFSVTKHDKFDVFGTSVQFSVSLYLKTASRSKGYGPVLGCLRTVTGKVTLLRSPESKS